MEEIERIRDRSGVPFYINSAYRTVEYERSKGRSGNSYHCFGKALDIRCTDSSDRYRIIEAVMHYGILSVMIYPTFLHIDDRKNKKLMVYVEQS